MHTSFCVGDKIFVLGGVANNLPFEDLWSFDVVAKQWREEFAPGAYPFARQGATVAVVQPPPSEYLAKLRPDVAPPGAPLNPDPPIVTGVVDAPAAADGKEDDEESEEEAMLLPVKLARPLDRFRKEFTLNSFVLYFGGTSAVQE
jgi:hypothetical protein